MRIGIVCPYSLDAPGGVQAHVMDLAAELRGRRHDVRVLAPAGADAALALGDVNAALGRALEAVRTHTGEEREEARLRLLELFEVIGSSAPEVARARRQLAALLF